MARFFLSRRLALLVLGLAVVALPACGPRRKTCYRVTGTILVDGKPAKDVFIVLNPAVKEAERLAPNAQTDENGQFRLSTYDEADGAPAGDYQVTFTWREASGLLKNQYDGPDRFKGAYGDPAKNLFPVTILTQTTELPPFRLERR